MTNYSKTVYATAAGAYAAVVADTRSQMAPEDVDGAIYDLRPTLVMHHMGSASVGLWHVADGEGDGIPGDEDGEQFYNLCALATEKIAEWSDSYGYGGICASPDRRVFAVAAGGGAQSAATILIWRE